MVEMTEAIRAARPGRFVAYIEQSVFDPFEFAQRQQAVLTPVASAPTVVSWSRTETLDDVWRTGRFGWFDLEWNGLRLEVVCAHFGIAGAYPETSWWIVAAEEADARQLFLEICRFCEDVRGQVLVFSDGHFAKSTELHQAVKQSHWSDLVLPGTLAQDLRSDALRFFQHRAFYEQHRLPWKRGVLLIGPPGNGKSHAVRALLNELDRPTIVVRGFDGRNDTPAAGIQKVFERARHTAPTIIVLEDLDCLVDERSRSVLLNELDGLALNTGLFVIGTTNHPEKIDRSLLDRPSRFDRKFHFPLPDAAVRRAFLERLDGSATADLRLSPDGLSLMVDRTQGFTFAYLKELHLSACLRWADEQGRRCFDAVMRETADVLSGDLKSVVQSIGPLPSSRPMGFGEVSARSG
jgi:hypothetical protein